jgi:hypothetical protein
VITAIFAVFPPPPFFPVNFGLVAESSSQESTMQVGGVLRGKENKNAARIFSLFGGKKTCSRFPKSSRGYVSVSVDLDTTG